MGRLVVTVLLPALLLPLHAGAQAAQDERLSRLDSRTRAAVVAIVDSARATGLPTEPLVDKALEGASKRAEGARIAAAVRSLSRELAAARAALGVVASEAELVAAADALRAGAGESVLTRLRAMRQTEALTIPLAVLSDLVARGVPADTATGAVLTLAGTGAKDADFVTLRRNVERDIMAGAPPVVAASIRSKGLPSSLPPSPGRGVVDAASPQTLEGTKRRP